GDFNGDGLVDLAVADYAYPSGVSLLLSAGGSLADNTFAFQPALFAPVPVGNTNTLVAGDFNGDKRLDLAVGIANASYAGVELAVFLNNGAGGFNAPATSALDATVRSLVTGDFNGDG